MEGQLETTNQPTVKRTRKAVPKSRNGCSTCKTRHVKCDEEKPACHQCVRTGRKCDFLNQTLQSSVVPKPSKIQQSSRKSAIATTRGKIGGPIIILPKLSDSLRAPIPERDAIYMNYFRGLCTEMFSGYLVVGDWRQIVIQAAEAEPAIQQAAVALACAHRVINYPNAAKHVEQDHKPALYYHSALKLLNKRLDGTFYSQKLAMIGSILFMIFEMCRGQEEYALRHLHGGLGIARDVVSKTPHILSSPGIFRDLLLAFSHLDSHACVLKGEHTRCKAEFPSLQVVPDTFDKVSAACVNLYDISAGLHQLIRFHNEEDSTLPYSPVPAALDARVKLIQGNYQKWRRVFQDYQDRVANITNRDEKEIKSDEYEINILLLHWESVWVHISTLCYRDELSYDAFSREFTSILDRADKVFVSRCFQSPGQLWLGLGITQPLHFVATKCRSRAIRLRAMKLLNLTGKEGAWNGFAMSAASWWISEREHSNPGGKRLSFVPEHRRLRDNYLEFDREESIGTIRSTRRDLDGSVTILLGTVKWLPYGDGDFGTILETKEIRA
ncbi:hypothetical protein BJ875DRAFT_546762 [Amylocarpus encephaloides]|uniref:Zn(2)-C6 fungal-type domain-containing protein n=1 Tax=Amylocarpus encephaloides TaxID=45428 RepID=A0A9P8C191_9HELO|nr:hypothetical protein BJ875DRAFT_546762 [Amylocarpus encephaloides]